MVILACIMHGRPAGISTGRRFAVVGRSKPMPRIQGGATIIFHGAPKEKGRTPFISLGSVGSHVVVVVWTHLPVTPQYNRPTSFTSQSRWPLYLLDISVIAGLNPAPCWVLCPPAIQEWAILNYPGLRTNFFLPPPPP